MAWYNFVATYPNLISHYLKSNTCTLIIVKVVLQIYIPRYYWLGTMQLPDVIYLMSISQCIPHCFLYFVPIGMLV